MQSRLREVPAQSAGEGAFLLSGGRRWTDMELAAARAAQFEDASLGKLILRTETAFVASLAALNSPSPINAKPLCSGRSTAAGWRFGVRLEC